MPVRKGNLVIEKIFRGSQRIDLGFLGVNRIFAACLTVDWGNLGAWSSWTTTFAASSGTCVNCNDLENTGVEAESRTVCNTVAWGSFGSWSGYDFTTNPATGTCSNCTNLNNTGFESQSRSEWRSRSRFCTQDTTSTVCATVAWGSFGTWTGYDYSTNQTSGTCSNCLNVGNTGFESDSRTEWSSRSRTCNQTSTNTVCATVGWGSFGTWSGFDFTSNQTSGTCTGCNNTGNTGFESESRSEWRSMSRTCNQTGTSTVCATVAWSSSGVLSAYSFTSNPTSGTCSNCSNINNTGFDGFSRTEYSTRTATCSQSFGPQIQTRTRTVSQACVWPAWSGWTTFTGTQSELRPACSSGALARRVQIRIRSSIFSAWGSWTFTSSCSSATNTQCRRIEHTAQTTCNYGAWSAWSNVTSCTANTADCFSTTLNRQCQSVSVCVSAQYGAWTAFSSWSPTNPGGTTTPTCSCTSGAVVRRQTNTRTMWARAARTCVQSTTSTVCSTAAFGAFGAWTAWGTTNPGTGIATCSCSALGQVNRTVETRTMWRRRTRTCNQATTSQVCASAAFGAWTAFGAWVATNPGTGAASCACASLGGVQRELQTRTMWRRRNRTCNQATTSQVCATASFKAYGAWSGWVTTNPGAGATTCACANLNAENRQVESRTTWRRRSRTCNQTSTVNEYRTRNRTCIQTSP